MATGGRLEDFGELSAAEQALVDACRKGERCMLGDGSRPEGPDDERNIRAELLRFLILGGDETCRTHTSGPQLMGAYVTGTLSLDFGRAVGVTGLMNCRFAEKISALHTRFELLSLAGSACPGLMAEGAKVAGAVFLRAGFHAAGEVRLVGAKIGGALDCHWGRFDNANGQALNAERVTVMGDVLLAKGFHATGEVSLSAAKIGGQLACDGGRFDNAAGDALVAQGAKVRGSFFWRNVTVDAGWVDLVAAHVANLVDDPESWPKGDNSLILDGFTYDRIGNSFTDAPSRLKWLARGTIWNGTFFPQPYGQLARVLRYMGHDRAARQVLMERERLLAADQWKQDQKRAASLWAGDQTTRGDIGLHWLRSRLARLWSALIRIVAGYGHAPERALYCATAFLLFGTVFYFICWRMGAIVPNSPVILTSVDWGQALLSNAAAPSLDWVNLPSARHYETFYAFPYTLDIFAPFVDLGQETAWSETTVTWLGWSARAIAMAIEVAGWFISALAAAALTGLIQRQDD